MRLKTRHAKHAEPGAKNSPRGFATPSHKVELYSQTFLEHGYAPLPDFSEPQIGPVSRPDLAARFPLILTSAKSALFCQTQHRALPRLRKRAPHPEVELHPAAAQARGIAYGDWVSIVTPEGSVRACARLNDNLDPRVVVGEHGWWQPCAEIGAPGYDPFGPQSASLNLIIGTAALDPVSGTASHRSICVKSGAPPEAHFAHILEIPRCRSRHCSRVVRLSQATRRGKAMSELQIIGAPQSNYVWVTRIACHEKGVPYALVPVMPHTPDVDAIHPLGKIPALRHGDLALAESRAICFYIDHAFAGPPLVSRDPAEGARTEQWISIVNTHFDVLVARPYVGAYFFPGTADGKPNRAVIEPLLPRLEAQFAMLDRAAANTGHLAGSSFTLADMNLLPMLFYLHHLPESSAMLRRNPDLGAYYERHIARASVREAVPPPFPGRSSWSVEG